VKIRMVGDNVGECVARDTALKKKRALKDARLSPKNSDYVVK
jgi:hypothetical protein